MKQSETRGIILELKPKDGVDFIEFVVDHANGRAVDLSGYEVRMCNPVVHAFRQDFVDYIVEHGLSSLLRQELIVEALVPPGRAPDLIETLLRRFVQEIAVSGELVIVDPYFMPKKAEAGYPTLVANVLDPVLSRLTTVKVITRKDFDPGVKSDVVSALKARSPQLDFQHATSDVFHDRYWICRQGMKGFLMGTSLNGLGRKYALVDHLRESDVQDIVKVLESEQLV